MKFAKQIIGWHDFNGSVDITDPCYGKDIWCRKNDVKISEGKYQCVTWICRKRDKHPDRRIAVIGIYLAGYIPVQNDMECIGEIGVDAGLAGFFNNKPDYTDAEWSEFCDKLCDGNAWLTEEGFWSSSGYGDGCYPVYAAKNQQGVINALEIRFI